jgi:hypothetical protein
MHFVRTAGYILLHLNINHEGTSNHANNRIYRRNWNRLTSKNRIPEGILTHLLIEKMVSEDV